MKKTIFAVIALVALTATASPAGIVFSDNWNDFTVNSPAYSPNGADWVVTQGVFSADAANPPLNYFNPGAISQMLLFGTSAGDRIQVDFGASSPGSAIEARFKLYQSNGAGGSGYMMIFGLGNTVAGKAYSERATLQPGYYGSSGFQTWVDYGGYYDLAAGKADTALQNGWNFMKMSFDPASGVKVFQAVTNDNTLAFDSPSLSYEQVAEWPNYWPLDSVNQFFIQTGNGIVSWFVDDVEIDGTLASGSISGKVVPADYGAALSGILLNVSLTKDSVTTDKAVILDDAGNFTIAGLAPGNYDVRMKACCWLARDMGTVVVAALNDANLGTINMVSGDLDGDNEVTSTDLSILGLNLGAVGD